MIQTKRVYEPASPQDGKRFLVERLWPRGLKKEELHMDAWLKDAAPSTELRHWFSHDPAKWAEFQKRYQAELNQHSEGLQSILQAAQQGDVTLLYSAHDSEHNNAVTLRNYLMTKLHHQE